MTTKIFEIDRLPNFLRYGAPLGHLRHAVTPLLEQPLTVIRVVTQRLSANEGEALHDDANNGCERDYRITCEIRAWTQVD